MRSPPRAPLALFVLACGVTAVGWWWFWFLTDDAFITYRYASNWMRGWGFTWNPPPFQPVEGYSNFLWLALLTDQVARNPPRSQGSELRWSERYLLAAGTVGVPGWVLPEVAILDMFGLSDRVIARAPLAVRDDERQMAHDRDPPPDYVRCLSPDLRHVKSDDAMLRFPLPPDVEPGALISLVQAVEREPLSDERIRDCEARAWYQ